MVNPPQGVEVTILGTKYTVVSDRDEEYLRELARYLDDKLSRVVAGRNIPLLQCAVLTALNIADELFDERGRRVDLLRQIEERSSELIGLLEDEKRPSTEGDTAD